MCLGAINSHAYNWILYCAAFQRMQIWERYLFSTLEEKQALSWRKAKEFEIQKWETKEEILAEIDRIRVQIKEKEKKEREKELQKEQQNVMASMMEGALYHPPPLFRLTSSS